MACYDTFFEALRHKDELYSFFHYQMSQASQNKLHERNAKMLDIFKEMQEILTIILTI